MNYAAYHRLVSAYHGCDTRVARDVLDRNQALSPSENDYDWLGHGIYFWEHGPARALEWAEQQKNRGKIENPAVVGSFCIWGTASIFWTPPSLICWDPFSRPLNSTCNLPIR